MVIASTNPKFDAGFLRASPRLILLARHGVGYDNVDLDAASRLGIAVTKVPGPVEREAMAEHTVALLLALACDSKHEEEEVAPLPDPGGVLAERSTLFDAGMAHHVVRRFR